MTISDLARQVQKGLRYGRTLEVEFGKLLEQLEVHNNGLHKLALQLEALESTAASNASATRSIPKW